MSIQYKPRKASTLQRTIQARASKPMPRRGAKAKARPAPAGRHCTVDPAIVFNDLLPDMRESKDDFAWACCPFHNDNNPSFSVNLRTGWYRCFSSSCGETGGNIVSFVGALLAIEPADARRHLENHYG